MASLPPHSVGQTVPKIHRISRGRKRDPSTHLSMEECQRHIIRQVCGIGEI